MAIHPKDKNADNPRIQCSVCGKWKRLITKAPQPPHELNQTFFGGCGFSDGNHLAGDHQDVCEPCCQRKCRKMPGAKYLDGNKA